MDFEDHKFRLQFTRVALVDLFRDDSMVQKSVQKTSEIVMNYNETMK